MFHNIGHLNDIYTIEWCFMSFGGHFRIIGVWFANEAIMTINRFIVKFHDNQ